MLITALLLTARDTGQAEHGQSASCEFDTNQLARRRPGPPHVRGLGHTDHCDRVSFQVAGHVVVSHFTG